MTISGIIYSLSFLLILHGGSTSLSIASFGFFTSMIINSVATMINIQREVSGNTTFENAQSKISSLIGALISIVPLVLVMSLTNNLNNEIELELEKQ